MPISSISQIWTNTQFCCAWFCCWHTIIPSRFMFYLSIFFTGILVLAWPPSVNLAPNNSLDNMKRHCHNKPRHKLKQCVDIWDVLYIKYLLSWNMRKRHWCFECQAVMLQHNDSAYSTDNFHDDVIKWKHFPRYWPYVRGIHRSSVISPHKGQRHGALIFSLICAWINCLVNNREAGDLRRHRAHYGVTLRALWVQGFVVNHAIQTVSVNKFWVMPINKIA